MTDKWCGSASDTRDRSGWDGSTTDCAGDGDHDADLDPEFFPREPPVADGRAHVTFINGVPGSGKTHRLREYARHERDTYDTALTDSLFLTFTNAATNETQTQVHDHVYPDADEDTVAARVRTMHSVALQQVQRDGVLELADDPDDAGHFLIDRRTTGRKSNLAAECYTAFFRTHFPALDYDHGAADPMAHNNDGDVTEIPAGNQLLSLYDYCKSKQWSVGRFHEAPLFDEIGVSPKRTADVLSKWPTFKHKHDLIEHHDYVERAIETNAVPACSVVYVDEFQDLSPLEHAYYTAIRDSGATARAYIAGDDLQSIYGFRGGSPALVRETAIDRHDPQHESWRCRQAVLDAAVQVVEGSRENGTPDVTARHTSDRGHATHIDIANPSKLGDAVQAILRCDPHDSVFLLTRTNQQAWKVATGLRSAGIPYRGVRDAGDYYGWCDPLPTLLAAFRALNDERPWPTSVASTVLANLAPADARIHVQDAAAAERLSSYTEFDVVTGFLPGQYRTWLPELSNLSDSDGQSEAQALVRHLTLSESSRDRLAYALDRGAGHEYTDVRIGTIHAAKGLEADCVFLFPAYSRAQLDRYRNDTQTAAEEQRVYYVGLTRAAHTAYVVHNYFGGKEFPPLDPTVGKSHALDTR